VRAGAVSATPAYTSEVFGPVAVVNTFHDLDEAAALASDTEYALSLGIPTADVSKALALADRIPTGIVHINDQTVDDEAVAPFGGRGRVRHRRSVRRSGRKHRGIHRHAVADHARHDQPVI
jgi:benzaldehyde dehydrogenase (NAD)